MIWITIKPDDILLEKIDLLIKYDDLTRVDKPKLSQSCFFGVA